MVIDYHNHIWIGDSTGEGFLDTPMTIDVLLKEMDKGDVEIAGVCSIAQSINNEYVIENCKKYPDRIFGYAFENPREKGAVEDFRRCLDQGQKGLKLHPRFHGYFISLIDLVGPLMELCEEYKVPMFAHGGDEEFNTPFLFEELAKEFPRVPVIIGHMGAHSMADLAIKVAKRNKNVYLDTSDATLENVKTALRQGLVDKMFMSTDWPESDFRLEQLKIDIATEDDPNKEVTRRKLKAENYAKLTGMKI
jgi:predicted TIM-barrel fold metal-dependent hydrolase